jgi:galactose mutarotase-like enzyme
VPGLNPAQFGNEREFDFGLAAPQNGRARFEIPNLGRLELSFSPEMRHMQFWSQPGKDFICLEPFTGPNNTVNTDRRVDIAPGTAHTFFMRIEVE